jgi:flagellar assembly factor FliW
LKNIAVLEHAHHPPIRSDAEFVVRMDEGLIGFSQYREFMFLENSDVQPFRLMESVASPRTAFAVLDPTILVPRYLDFVPLREWEAIGLTDRSSRLAFVIASIGMTAKESTANLQAPVLINYQRMTARQVILTDSPFSAKTSLIES